MHIWGIAGLHSKSSMNKVSHFHILAMQILRQEQNKSTKGKVAMPSTRSIFCSNPNFYKIRLHLLDLKNTCYTLKLRHSTIYFISLNYILIVSTISICLSGFGIHHGGQGASWLVFLSPWIKQSWFKPWPGTLCCVLGHWHLTLTEPLSTL